MWVVVIVFTLCVIVLCVNFSFCYNFSGRLRPNPHVGKASCRGTHEQSAAKQAATINDAWRRGKGCPPAEPRAIIVARTPDEQSTAIRALQLSRCPNLFGLDFEHSTGTDKILRKKGYAEKLGRALSLPKDQKLALMEQGEWPELRNPDWPSKAPLCTNPALFFENGHSGRFRKGPLVRTIQLANVEGLAVIIDAVPGGEKFSLHPGVAELLADPSRKKFIHDWRQDWRALGFSFAEGAFVFKHSREPDSENKIQWSSPETAGWIDTQPIVGNRRVGLTDSLKLSFADSGTVERYAELKDLMRPLFKLPLATLRPFEEFGRIVVNGQRSDDLANQCVEYAAMDATAALFVGMMQALLMKRQGLVGGELFAQLSSQVWSCEGGDKPEPGESEIFSDAFNWNAMVEVLGDLMPGQPRACKFSRMI